MNKKIVVATVALLILLCSIFFIGLKIYSFKSKSNSIIQSNGSVNFPIKKRLPLLGTGNFWECVEMANQNSDYKKVNGYVYSDNAIIEGADYNSFEIMDDDKCYAKDKNFVYIFGNPIVNLDSQTFEIIGGYLIKDKKGIYFASIVERPGNEMNSYLNLDFEKKIKCDDFANDFTWSIVDNDDKRIKIIQKINENAFVIEKIEDLDSSTTQFINSFGFNFIKDKNNVYLIKNLSSHSCSGCIDTNAEKLYSLTNIKGVDPESFEIINEFYLKDKNNVIAYLSSMGKQSDEFKIIPGSDPASFKTIDIADKAKSIGISSYNFIGISGEDDKNYYARDLVIPKDREVYHWISNPSENPKSCQQLCEERDLRIAPNKCYDNNFDLCTISKDGFCTVGNEKLIIKKDQGTRCCCSGPTVSWVMKENNQLNFCISTDGVNPFMKGQARTLSSAGSPGNIVDDSCNNSEIVDWFCDSMGQMVSNIGMICPNGCYDGACLPFDEKQKNNNTNNSNILLTIKDKQGNLLPGIMCDLETNSKDNLQMEIISSISSNNSGDCFFSNLDPKGPYVVNIYWTGDKSVVSSMSLGSLIPNQTITRTVVSPH